MASACLIAAGIGAGKRVVDAGRRTSRSRALGGDAMFTFLVTQSLRNRLLVLALALVLVVFGAIARHAPAGRCVSRPEQADRHHHDRGRRPRAAGGRAAGQLSDRNADERRAGRHARALGLRRRPFDRLCRVRLGHRHLPQPPAGRRTACAGARAAAAQHHAADGPDQLDHGADPADRADQRRAPRRWSCARWRTSRSGRGF